MTHDLKPCPFCGGNKLNICATEFTGEPKPRQAYAVGCRSVGCHGGIFSLGYGEFKTERLAVIAWNRRAADSSPPSRRGRGDMWSSTGIKFG